jgi:hypothetical protein
MKTYIFVFVIILAANSVFSQVSEKTSGIQYLNISRQGSVSQSQNDNKVLNDNQPPVISIISPGISADSSFSNTFKTLNVRGKVADSGGIYEVLVNGYEAEVFFDGTFYVEIPQAYGRNLIIIKATDVSLNSSVLQFYSERLTENTADLNSRLSGNKSNTSSIDLITPSGNYSFVSEDKIRLEACIKASAAINRLFIYRNNSYVNGYLTNQIIKDGSCDFKVDTPVSLKLGKNEIKIEVFTVADTIIKTATVEYSFYAARNFALLIGNERYDDPSIMDLSEPLQDVDELYNTLISDYNFNTSNVILLKNSTKAEVIGTLHKLRSRILPTDNLLIFYAGHGYWDEGMGVGYWLPRDASLDNPVNWIPNTDLTNYLSAIKTKHTLLIADACFSGGIFKTTRSTKANTYAIEKLYQLPSRKAITSGTLTAVPDRSPFFKYLIKNLKENNKEFLPAEELFSQMKIAVINNSDNVPQFGTIQNAGDEGGDFIFIRRRK